MGIKNLRKFLKKAAPGGISQVSFFESYAGKKICIDVNSYLYKMAYNKETKGENYYLKGFTQIISDFLAYNILPILFCQQYNILQYCSSWQYILHYCSSQQYVLHY